MGHGLLLHCLQAQQQRAGFVQPEHIGVELSRGFLRTCSLLFESDLGSDEPNLGWLHSMCKSVGRH